MTLRVRTRTVGTDRVAIQWLSYLLAGLAVILLLIKEFIARPQAGRIWPWRLGWIGSFLLAIVVFLNVPNLSLTEDSVAEAAKQGTQEALCEWDAYKSSLPQPGEDVSAERREELRRAAECLSSQAETAFDSALVSMGRGDYGQAIVHWGYALDAALNVPQRDTAKLSEISFYRANVLLILGREAEALSGYDSALSFDHRDNRSWHNRGVVLNRFEQSEEALASFDSAIAYGHRRSDCFTWSDRCATLVELGRYLEAVESCDSAVECVSNDDVAWYNRGLALLRLLAIDEAIASFDSALKYNNRLYDAWMSRGSALAFVSRYEEAIVSLDSCLAYKHDKHEAWTGRCACLLGLGNLQAALASCDSALRYEPASEAALDLRLAIERLIEVGD